MDSYNHSYNQKKDEHQTQDLSYEKHIEFQDMETQYAMNHLFIACNKNNSKDVDKFLPTVLSLMTSEKIKEFIEIPLRHKNIEIIKKFQQYNLPFPYKKCIEHAIFYKNDILLNHFWETAFEIFNQDKLTINYFLHYSLAKNKLEVADILIQEGFDINKINLISTFIPYSHETPISDDEIAKFKFCYDNVNDKDTFSYSLIHYSRDNFSCWIKNYLSSQLKHSLENNLIERDSTTQIKL